MKGRVPVRLNRRLGVRVGVFVALYVAVLLAPSLPHPPDPEQLKWLLGFGAVVVAGDTFRATDTVLRDVQSPP